MYNYYTMKSIDHEHLSVEHKYFASYLLVECCSLHEAEQHS